MFDGQGNECAATLEGGKKKAQVRLDAVIQVSRESPLTTELAIGLSKGDRFEWVLQKATELGVSKIVPLLTERSEVKLSGPRLEKKLQQWQQIIISACEQCQRNYLPALIAPMALDQWLQQRDQKALALVLHHRSDKQLSDYSQPSQGASLLIGPEGGLSDNEITLALSQGCHALTMGPRVLRTETAPIAALSLLQHLWGTFKAL